MAKRSMVPHVSEDGKIIYEEKVEDRRAPAAPIFSMLYAMYHCGNMSSLVESIKKGPLMTMTLECETEFPKALKNLMESMGLEGEAVYKRFPVIDEGQEFWWVEFHLYKSKGDDHKKIVFWMFTNSELHMSFLDSARSVAWVAITEIGERLKYRMLKTQQDLKEEKEETANLRTSISRLHNKLENTTLTLSFCKELNKSKDLVILALMD